jgi:uncharacterized protein (DUF305 family)
MKRSLQTIALAGLLALAVSACDTATAAAQPRFSPADVSFMQGMIGHHAQALEMTALVPARTARADLRLLAERIRVSQESEIKTMEQWLLARGEQLPCLEPGHQHGGMEHMLMPGMATPEQMARMAAATGAEFDRLFLESMIRHHQGALAMVAALFATPGAGQEPQVFGFASDVDADQRAEIARMEALLGALPRP